MSQTSTLPTHLGLILDGNRRWARDQGLPTLEGHKKGYENLKTISRAAFEKGVKYVSAYIFSTENWNRTKDEVSYLMNLVLWIAEKDIKQLIKENVRVVVLGIEDRVPPRALKALRRAEADSTDNTGGTLALCFNYGGQQEIVDATKKLIDLGVNSADVSVESFQDQLYHPEVPPVDLMIRSSGEMRLSNFMLWRMAYAELYFADKHWPAFDTEDLDEALAEYENRHRRFGK